MCGRRSTPPLKQRELRAEIVILPNIPDCVAQAPRKRKDKGSNGPRGLRMSHGCTTHGSTCTDCANVKVARGRTCYLFDG